MKFGSAGLVSGLIEMMIKNLSKEEVFISNKDDGQLYYKVFRPKAKSKKVLIVHHGFGEHGGKYNLLVEALADKGYVIYLIDSRGHGRSSGVRGVGPFHGGCDYFPLFRYGSIPR